MSNNIYQNKLNTTNVSKSGARYKADAGMGSTVANISAVAIDIGLLLFHTSGKKQVAFTAFKIARYALRSYVLIKNAKSKSTVVSVQTDSTITTKYKH